MPPVMFLEKSWSGQIPHISPLLSPNLNLSIGILNVYCSEQHSLATGIHPSPPPKDSFIKSFLEVTTVAQAITVPRGPPLAEKQRKCTLLHLHCYENTHSELWMKILSEVLEIKERTLVPTLFPQHFLFQASFSSPILTFLLSKYQRCPFYSIELKKNKIPTPPGRLSFPPSRRAVYVCCCCQQMLVQA